MRDLALCLAVLLAPAARTAAPVKLVYALPVSVPAVIPFVAIDKGFFKAEGLEVEARLFSSGREALQALLAGQAQLQTVSETPVVHSIVQGNRVAVIATVARHQEAKLISRKESGIAEPADLKGKKVATLPGTNSDYFMHRYLAAHGLAPADLSLMNMPPPQMVAALVNGDIDAYFAWEPHIHYGRRKLEGARVVYPGKLYQGWATVNMDPDYAAANPQTVRKALRALIAAEAWVKAHKDEAVALVSKKLDIEEPVLRALWDECVFKVELDRSLLPQMRDIGAWSAGMSKSDKPLPDFRQYIHDEPLRKERPKSVSL
jgi:ABC-type nitrate/sulfonate/bicarbonate transport system substrate-binding protein